MSSVTICQATASQADQISALALRSKAHWGYSAEFLDMCREELTYGPDDCRSGRLWVACRDETLLGFYLVSGEPPVGELAALFVDPQHIGEGVGRRLLEHAFGVALDAGFRELHLDADPDAEAFYRHHGAQRIGSSPSGSIPGRSLPRLSFALDGTGRRGA
jgi:GNAT superfamily N-acetyltransferase